MRIEIEHVDNWQTIKNSALFTIHKKKGSYPTSEWKENMLIAEHSPIRDGRLIINIYEIPSFVVGHFVRHWNGIEKYVSTHRSDRIDYDEVPNRNTLQNLRINIGFQAFINISRKRYCFQASKETREVWNAIMEEVEKFEPELSLVCVPECVYRCGCSEIMGKCGLFGRFLNQVKYNYASECLFNIKQRYVLWKEYKNNEKLYLTEDKVV